MTRFPEAEARIFEGKWVCRNCEEVMKAPPGRKPEKCRKCSSTKDFRIKHKTKKK